MSIKVDNNLFEGRPAEKRSDIEEKTYDFLESIGVVFQRADHEAANTIDDCLAVEKVIGVHICKNLFLSNRQGTEFFLLLMPGDKEFRTSVVSKIIGKARLSFGSYDKMYEYLSLSPGSVSLLGLINDTGNRVQLLIDSDVLRFSHIRCHPCVNTSTLKIKKSDLLEKILPALNHEPLIIDIPDANEEK